MGDPIQLALMLGPLSIYFHVLGFWHGGRRPRVVSGSVDHALLSFGVFGLVVIGPAGAVARSLLFGPPEPWVWALWGLFVLLWMAFLGAGTGRRTVVYKVDEPTLREAVEAAVERLGPGYVARVDGFENERRRLVVRVQPPSFLQVGVVEVVGPEATSEAERLRTELNREFSRIRNGGPNRIAWCLLVFSWIAMLAAPADLILNEPEAQRMIRAFLDRMQGPK